MTDKGTILDLDELFGTKEPVLVVLKGKQYELYRPDSWSPDQYAKYAALQHSVTMAEIEGSMETPEGMNKLAETVQKMLEIISPDLAAQGLSFDWQSKIVEHYAKIVFPEQMKIATELMETQAKAKNMTGA
jgi:hypothetical protein